MRFQSLRRFAVVMLILSGVSSARAESPVVTGPRGVIDAHAHLSLQGARNIAKIMGQNGIRAMVNLSGGSPGMGMEQAVALAKMFGGRIVNFYTPDWSRVDEPDFGVVEAARLEAAVTRYDYKGLKIAKVLGLGLRWASGVLVDVDDPVMDPLWQKAGELGIPVSIHVGDPKAFFEPLTPQNERWEELSVHPSWSFHGADYPTFQGILDAFERVVERHPRTTFIGVHFGNDAEDLAWVDRMLDTYPNLMIDIAARVGEFGRHPADKVRAFFVKHQDRILFGTDIGVGADHLMLGSNGAVPPTMDDVKPFYDAHWRYLETTDARIDHPSPIQGRWKVDAIGLPKDVLQKLYIGNANRMIFKGKVP